MKISKAEDRSRALVARCRHLADTAADLETAKALREIASDLESLWSVLRDARGKAAN